MKIARKPWSLKTLFALASTACVFLTVIIGYFGLLAYGDFQYEELKNFMPPAAIRAQEALNANQVPSPLDMIAATTFAETLETDFYHQQQFVLFLLSLVSATLGAGLSIYLADRLVRPIAQVAEAARAIAKGDLSARAKGANSSIGESAQLARDFNRMAGALERYGREMSESSAAIAHELRTPLTVLRGYVQGSIDGVFPSTDAHKNLLLVHIESLSRIVDDLQTLSLSKSGTLSMSMAAIDASHELGTLLDAMHPAIKVTGLVLERALDSAPMRGDPARLRQAVAALIENARHYAVAGGMIRVQTQATADGVIVRVLDRGPGLPENQLVSSFDRFWRGEPSRNKHTGGSGLGLSVVKAIVDAHGGDARLLNRPSGGLCVELTFPNSPPSKAPKT